MNEYMLAVILVTTLCWLIYDGEILTMLVTESLLVTFSILKIRHQLY